MNRRIYLLGAVGACAQAALSPAVAQTASRPSAAAKPKAAAAFSNLKIYIPAGAGGGWDQTGRGLGEAILSGGLVQNIAYENKGGKGGTIGLADFSARYGKDPQSLFIGGLVMVGAIALNKSEVTMKQLAPLARLTSDYMVFVTSPGSKINNTKALVAQLQRDPGSVVFTGGSAGGVDHMLAAMVLRALRLDPSAMKYMPTSSGKEALALLQSGQVSVAISGYSEFKTGIEDKSLVPLAVSSRKSLFGIPSLREQGIDTELANWRAVFAPADISPAQKEALRKMLIQATETPAWRQTLLDNNWVGSLLYGKELDRFIEFENGIATVITSMLKLKT